MLLYIIRHGDPVYNPDSLTQKGRLQAEAVAKRVALHGVDEIFASTSNRAMQTAQPTCELLKMEMETVDFANEKYDVTTDFAIISVKFIFFPMNFSICYMSSIFRY